MVNPVVDALKKSFVWGDGGAALSPEEIAQRRQQEARLLAGGVDTSPVQHWAQGLARVANAAAGSFRRGQLDEAESGNIAFTDNEVAKALAGSYLAKPGFIGTSGATGELAATGPVQPIDMTGNDVYSGFMDTVRSGVQNPYALAAIAATGKAESGFAPGNVNRTWSDPSESGQAGTAGGILSWRGPRYQALAATGDLSPQGQAKFFLQENPQLIQSLNNAGSVEEAQSLMNNAWKFAGYDRPGGEAARRLAAAQGFLPSFQSGGEVAAGTPEAAIEAVSPIAGGSLSDEVSDFEQTPAYSAQFPGMAQQTQQRPVGQTNTVAQVLTSGQTQNTTAINPAILRALADKRVTPEGRSIISTILQQQMAERSAAQEQQAARDSWLFQQQYQEQAQGRDPLRQLQIRQAERELNTPAKRGTTTINGRLVDEQTGQVIAEFPDQVKPTADRQNYEYYRDFETKNGREPLGPLEWEIAQRKAGATSVSMGGENSADAELRKKLSGKEGEAWAAYKEAGTVSAGTMQDMQLLDELMKQAPQGPIRGRLAQAFPGVSSAGAAFESIIKRVAPTLRAPGSGATSDIEYDGMLRSLPGLSNYPEANQAVSEMMKAKAQINIERSRVIDEYQNEEISASEARRRMAALNSRSIMSPKIEEAFQRIGIDVREPQKGEGPMTGDIVDGYRFKGGNPADQSNWEQVR